jgi:hypothetical protein
MLTISSKLVTGDSQDPLDPGIQDFSRGNPLQYTRLCVPLGVLCVLVQLAGLIQRWSNGVSAI